MSNYLLAKNVHLHIYPTNQFKDVTLSVRFCDFIDQCDNTIYFFLSQFLIDRSLDYPSKVAVTQMQDQLYGAQLSSENNFTGLAHTINFQCSTINGKFINEDLLEKQTKFLSSFIFNPIFDDFTYFEEIKQRLLLMVSSYLDNPSSLASNQAERHFNSIFNLRTIPTPDAIESCTMENLKDSYKKLIENNRIDILVLGDVEEESTFSSMKKFFPFKDRNFSDQPFYFLASKEKADNFVENKDLQQSHLLLYYTTQKNINDDDHFALLVANGIFGGLPSSYLFQEVREKRSLCYSIRSSYESFDGLIKVQTAISEKSIPEVIVLVEEQINKIKSQEFSEELLETTKKMIINSLISSKDYQSRTLNQNYTNTLLKKDRPLEYMLENIQKVTSQMIANSFENLELKMTYALTKGDQ